MSISQLWPIGNSIRAAKEKKEMNDRNIMDREGRPMRVISMLYSIRKVYGEAFVSTLIKLFNNKKFELDNTEFYILSELYERARTKK